MAGYPEDEWDTRMAGFLNNRTGIGLQPGSVSFETIASDLGFLYDTNKDGLLPIREAYAGLKKDMELPDYSGAAESAFNEVLVTEDEAAENIYRMLDALGAPKDQWADALRYAADACILEESVDPFFTEPNNCHWGPCLKFVDGATWEGPVPDDVSYCAEVTVYPVNKWEHWGYLPECTLVDNSKSQVMLMENLSAEQSGFDWSAAVIGASIGFVASITALRSCCTKTQQEKRLAEPLL